MSRLYSMSVEINDFDPGKAQEVRDAVVLEWPGFGGSWWGNDVSLSASGDDNLCGGESAEEFAERLARAAWRANGRPCEVCVEATCLEDLPCESYTLDETDYERVMAGKQPKKAPTAHENGEPE